MKWYWILLAASVAVAVAAQAIGIIDFDSSLPVQAWLVMGLAALSGGWMAFDGGRALVVGDYVTPSGGDMAGQLGPWSRLVEKIGIAPRSNLMKAIILIYGIAYVALALALVLGIQGVWLPLLLVAALGLWYLPFGTLLNAIAIILLMLPALRLA